MGFGKVGFGEVRLGEVGIGKLGFGEVGFGKVRFGEVGGNPFRYLLCIFSVPFDVYSYRGAGTSSIRDEQTTTHNIVICCFIRIFVNYLWVCHF